MKQTIWIIFFLCYTILGFAQTTYFNSTPVISGKEATRLYSLENKENCVIVTIEVKSIKHNKRINYWCTPNTFITTGNTILLQVAGYLINGNIEQCGYNHQWGWSDVNEGEKRYYKLYFPGTIPGGITNISIEDAGDYNGAHSYCFRNYTINNPRRDFVNISSENAAKQNIDSNNDGICGIYEPVGGGAYLACVKINNDYKLIYLSSPANYPQRSYWQIGDIKANLRQTAAGVMKADWYNSKKEKSEAYVAFDGRSLKCIVAKEELTYLKTYPTNAATIGSGASGDKTGEWTGTGFALFNGYVITNNHVIDGAKTILVLGVNGNNNIEYKAQVVSVDKNNDLALIKINDSRFNGFSNVPYAITNRICDVGEDVFVLGYPLTSYMGDEIKLTNGIISSRSGYLGDITTYQISAPIQPGNSGGPLFDNKGNVVGIVNAGIPGAENVGYAIKTSYLYNLVGNIISTTNIPQTNRVNGNSLADKVKSVKQCVFYIKCKGN